MLWGSLGCWNGPPQDLFFRLRPQEAPDAEIVIVTIDEADLKTIGEWPIPDVILAKALTQIQTLEPSVIGLDLYRDLPEEPGHQDLLAVFSINTKFDWR